MKRIKNYFSQMLGIRGWWVSEGRVKGNFNLTRGFGTFEYKQNKKLKPEEQMITANPEIKVVDFDKDIDFVIIGCDGI